MKILVAYDGSEAAQKALDFGMAQVLSFGGTIFIVRSLLIEDDPQEFLRQKERIEQELAVLESSLSEERFSVKTQILCRGLEPGEDIVEYARENKIDLIVAGIKRRSKIGKLLIGSNAQFINLNAPCPVLSVRASTPKDLDGWVSSAQ